MMNMRFTITFFQKLDFPLFSSECDVPNNPKVIERKMKIKATFVFIAVYVVLSPSHDPCKTNKANLAFHMTHENEYK